MGGINCDHLLPSKYCLKFSFMKQKKNNIGLMKKNYCRRGGQGLAVGFVNEVQYLEWLANAVSVKKAIEKW